MKRSVALNMAKKDDKTKVKVIHGQHKVQGGKMKEYVNCM